MTESRRQFLRRGLHQGLLGLGGMALGSDLLAAQDPQRRRRDGPPRAKSVIYLHMEGAPSPLDMFDEKPALYRYDGKKCPEEYLRGERFAFIKGHPKLLAPRWKFAPRGPAARRWAAGCRTGWAARTPTCRHSS